MALFRKKEDDEESNLKEAFEDEAPDDVKTMAAAVLGGEPSHCFSSDLTLDGDYAEVWLAVNDERLAVISPNGDIPELLREFEFARIEEFEIEKFIGNAILRAQVDGTPKDVTRFSLALTDKFDHILEILEGLRKTKRGEADYEDGKGDTGQGRCPKCHQIIPAWADECPNCKPKGRVLLRALAYLLPWWHLSLFTLVLMLIVTGLGMTSPIFMKILLDEVFVQRKIELAKAVGPTDTFLRTEAPPKVWPKKEAKRVLQIGEEKIRYRRRALEGDRFGFEGCERGAFGTEPAAHAAREMIRPPEAPFRERWRLLELIVFGGILGCRVASAVLGALRSYLMRYLGERIIMGLRNQVYAHIHRLSLGFYDQQQTGSLMYRVNADSGRLQNFIAGALQDLLRDVCTSLIICAVLFSMDFWLALIVLGPVPFIVWGSRVFGKRMHRLYHRVWKLGSAVNAVLADAIPGVRVVKAFDKERYEVRRYAHIQHKAFRVSMRAQLLSNVFWPALGLLTLIGTLTIWGYGGYMALSGAGMTVGTLILFLSYTRQFYGPINRLARFNDQIQRVSTSAERVFEILDAHPEVADKEDAVQLKEVEGRIEFENVTFAYPDNDPVINDLSMTVSPGEMIGIVGPSGAGKTTLINLVCRFYDVTEGAIRLDGHDLRDIAVHSLRSQIGVVLQEPYLFQGTIEENITYGRPEATREETLGATEAAHALDIIIRMDDAFDTLVGERGTRLSGGEKQRLSIARAILRNPKLLILDEATSAVDTETEDKIRRAIESLVENRTTLAIAHRLSTLRRATRLAVLDAGRLVELGTHEELLSKEDGLFKRLWSKQMSVAAEKAMSQMEESRELAEEPDDETGDGLLRIGANEATFSTDDDTWLHVVTNEGREFVKVRPVRAFPLTSPWECLLLCDEKDVPLAFLADTKGMPDDSFQALHQCLFWRYFIPRILDIRSVEQVSGSATKWEVVTTRGEREFLVKKRFDVRSLDPRRLLIRDSEGNRYDLPDYGELPPPSQVALERLQFL